MKVKVLRIFLSPTDMTNLKEIIRNILTYEKGNLVDSQRNLAKGIELL